MITKYKIFESLRDKMKPKSEEEIEKTLDKLSPERLLSVSTEKGYINGVKRSINLGVNPDYTDMLNKASQHGHLDIVKFAIKNGGDLDNWKDLPLRMSILNNHYDVAKYLIKQQPEKIKDESLLESIIMNKNENILKFLIEENIIDINILDGSLLKWASEYAYPDIIKYLIYKGIDVKSNYEGLESAAKGKHYNIVKLLLKNGAPISHGLLDLSDDDEKLKKIIDEFDN